MIDFDVKNLIQQAIAVRKNAYSPYSHFAVGAALLATDGTVYTGVNMENASYPVGLCAERSAFARAVSDGKRNFTVLVLIGGTVSEKNQVHDFCMPCGMCRQFMAEFCNKDFVILSAKSEDEYQMLTLGELLPYSFALEKGRLG